jgi:hypothetical protein
MRKGKLKAMLRFLIEFRKPKVQSLQSDYFIDTVGGYLKLSWNVERCRKVKVNRQKFSSSATIFIPFDSKKTTIKVSCRNFWRRSKYYIQLNPQLELIKQSEYLKKVRSVKTASFEHLPTILKELAISSSVLIRKPLIILRKPRIIFRKHTPKFIYQNHSLTRIVKEYGNK